MNREQYLHFWQELVQAEQAELKDFEQDTAKFFEGCCPLKLWPDAVKMPCAMVPSNP